MKKLGCPQLADFDNGMDFYDLTLRSCANVFIALFDQFPGAQ
jgi:hypothetical protein